MYSLLENSVPVKFEKTTNKNERKQVPMIHWTSTKTPKLQQTASRKIEKKKIQKKKQNVKDGGSTTRLSSRVFMISNHIASTKKKSSPAAEKTSELQQKENTKIQQQEEENVNNSEKIEKLMDDQIIYQLIQPILEVPKEKGTEFYNAVSLDVSNFENMVKKFRSATDENSKIPQFSWIDVLDNLQF